GALACAVPLVDPGPTAGLPGRSLDIACARLLPQHLDVPDPLLVVRLRRASAAERAVVLLEVLLRPDAKLLPRPHRLGTRDRLLHQFAPRSRTPAFLGGEHAADRRLRVLHPRGNEPAICKKRATAECIGSPQEMPARRVDPVHVLERAILLEYENAHARLEEVVDLANGELVERGEAPMHRRGLSP